MSHSEFHLLNVSYCEFVKLTVFNSENRFDLLKDYSDFLSAVTLLSDDDKAELSQSTDTARVSKKGKFEERPTESDRNFIVRDNSNEGSDDSDEGSDDSSYMPTENRRSESF